jgi:hypothetical protein
VVAVIGYLPVRAETDEAGPAEASATIKSPPSSRPIRHSLSQSVKHGADALRWETLLPTWVSAALAAAADSGLPNKVPPVARLRAASRCLPSSAVTPVGAHRQPARDRLADGDHVRVQVPHRGRAAGPDHVGVGLIQGQQRAVPAGQVAQRLMPGQAHLS